MSSELVRLVGQPAWAAGTSPCPPGLALEGGRDPASPAAACLGRRSPGRASPAWEGTAAPVPPPRAGSWEPASAGEETPCPAPAVSPHTQAGERAKT